MYGTPDTIKIPRSWYQTLFLAGIRWIATNTSSADAEDDADIHQYLSQLITDHDNFERLDSASTITEGLAALKKHKPDILLTDIGRPDGSGIEIIKAINKLHLDCEAMVVSGFQDENIVFKAREASTEALLHEAIKLRLIT